mmetsp:Transcript_31153/g.66899  ORF Transcript_31153/g.66899 Transcript_31153/m.66899 type:complete len:197 (-) Transcript_31153:78-668(-)
MTSTMAPLTLRASRRLRFPHAKGFNGSAIKHRFVGLCAEEERARLVGPVEVSTAFCGCECCTKFDFRNCKMHGLGGMATRLELKQVPRNDSSSAPSQTSTLAEFAAELRAGDLRAVRVDSAELHIEGDFYMCEVLGLAVQATERQAHATDLFEEEWWIVEIRGGTSTTRIQSRASTRYFRILGAGWRSMPLSVLAG